MRLLHTSDWHLGRTFHGCSLLADQEEVLTALADIVARESVDVVLIAGDLYDRAVPSVDAVALATRSLRRIRDAGAQIVVSSGNHDSAPRLGAFTDFLAAGGLHLRCAIDVLDRPVILHDEHGEVAIYGVPYLDPDVSRQVLGVPDAVGHAGVLGVAMDLVRADLAARPGRSVVLAHAFVVGGAPSESERSIDAGDSRAGAAPAVEAPIPDPTDVPGLVGFKRGTVGSVPGSVFDGPDYVALGHLHRRQRLSERIRYSGSPLPYSFSESGQQKGAWLVELDEHGLADVTLVDLPTVRELAVLRGRLAEVLAMADWYREHYVAVELTDEERPVDAMRTLQRRLPYVVRYDWCPPQQHASGPDYHVARRGLPDIELVDTFMSDCCGTPLTSEQRTLVLEALTASAAVESAATAPPTPRRSTSAASESAA
jgi:DNA repair protein SbcD/Mre11